MGPIEQSRALMGEENEALEIFREKKAMWEVARAEKERKMDEVAVGKS